MNQEQLRECTEGFQPSSYGRVQRSGETYVATERWARSVVTWALEQYRQMDRLDQTARLLRDQMEKALRRYHDYAIKERLGKPGAYYRDATIKPHEKTGLIFEHVIPVRYLINMLIQNKISIELAMNPPTCLLREAQDDILEKAGLGDRTPCPFNFWRRYQSLNIEIITHDNQPIDQSTWTPYDHFERFVK